MHFGAVSINCLHPYPSRNHTILFIPYISGIHIFTFVYLNYQYCLNSSLHQTICYMHFKLHFTIGTGQPFKKKMQISDKKVVKS